MRTSFGVTLAVGLCLVAIPASAGAPATGAPLHGDAACAALDGKSKSRMFDLTSGDPAALPFEGECLAFLMGKGTWHAAEGDNRTGPKKTSSGVTFGAPVPSDYSPYSIRERGFSFDWLVGISFGGAPAEGAVVKVVAPDFKAPGKPKVLHPKSGTAYLSVDHKESAEERKAAYALKADWRAVGGTIRIDRATIVPKDSEKQELARVWLEASIDVEVRRVDAAKGPGVLTGPVVTLKGKLLYRTRKDP